jgi:exodeoxyribonuclease III
VRCIVALNVRSGGGTRAARLCSYLDDLDPDTVLLTEWRNNASGRLFAAWAESRGMRHDGLTDGQTANGIFLASSDDFLSESVTPIGEGAGCLMLARFDWVTLLGCYFPQLNAKAVFFDRCLEVALRHPIVPFVLAGDLNTGNQLADRSERAGKYYCADHFDRLASAGGLLDLWRLTNGASREWTWHSTRGNGFRIDHAFGNDAFIASANPVCAYDRQARDDRLTDHSAVVVRIDDVAAVTPPVSVGPPRGSLSPLFRRS